MAEIIPTNRFTLVLGPVKVEVARFAGSAVVVADANGNPSSTTQTGADDLDTFKTLLANPLFAAGIILSDAVSLTQSFNVAFGTGTTAKVATLNATDLAADDVVILTFGF